MNSVEIQIMVETLRKRIEDDLWILSGLEELWGEKFRQENQPVLLRMRAERLERAAEEEAALYGDELARQICEIDNGISVPGDPDYNEEVAEWHVHQNSLRPTSKESLPEQKNSATTTAATTTASTATGTRAMANS